MTYTLWIILTASLVGILRFGWCFLNFAKDGDDGRCYLPSVLLGIVVAYILTHTLSGIYMVIGAALTGILTTFLVQWLHSRSVPQDASLVSSLQLFSQ